MRSVINVNSEIGTLALLAKNNCDRMGDIKPVWLALAILLVESKPLDLDLKITSSGI